MLRERSKGGKQPQEGPKPDLGNRPGRFFRRKGLGRAFEATHAPTRGRGLRLQCERPPCSSAAFRSQCFPLASFPETAFDCHLPPHSPRRRSLEEQGPPQARSPEWGGHTSTVRWRCLLWLYTELLRRKVFSRSHQTEYHLGQIAVFLLYQFINSFCHIKFHTKLKKLQWII